MFCQKNPHSVNRTLYSVKRALCSVKRALDFVKEPSPSIPAAMCVPKEPLIYQKSPTFRQKSFMFHQMSPPKEPFPYIPSKELCDHQTSLVYLSFPLPISVFSPSLFPHPPSIDSSPSLPHARRAILSTEPFILSKEPCILSKEPHILSKKPSLAVFTSRTPFHSAPLFSHTCTNTNAQESTELRTMTYLCVRHNAFTRARCDVCICVSCIVDI